VIRLLADSFSWGTFPDAIRFIVDNPGLLWHKSVEHMELSGAAIGIALLLALPLGVVLGHLRRGSFVAISVSNLGRALPSLVLIAFALFAVSGIAEAQPAGDARAADLVQSGKLRTALFLPQYTKDPVTGEIRGHDTGTVTVQATYQSVTGSDQITLTR